MLNQDKKGKDPRERKERLNSSRQRITEGRYADAVSVLERLVREDKTDQDALGLLAEAYVGMGKDDEAVDVLRELARASDELLRVYGILKIIVKRTEDPETSEGWRLAKEITPRPCGQALILGGLCQEMGRFESAEKYFREAIAHDPSEPDAYLMLGRLLDAQSKTKEASQLFSEAVRLAPDSIEIRFAWAQFLFKSAKWKEAESAVRDSLRLGLDTVEGRILLGRILEAKGLPQEAEESYRAAKKNAPRSQEACRRIGEFFMRRGQHEEAESLLREALRRNPAFVGCAIQLADILSGRGALDAAAECLEQMRSNRPQDPSLLFKLAWIRQQMGDMEGMRETYKALVALPLRGERHHRFLAWMALKEFDHAFKEAEDILDHWNASSEYVRMFRPWAEHWMKPNGDEYFENFERTLRALPNKETSAPWIALYRGLFFSRLKRREEALAVWSDLLKAPNERYGWMRFPAGEERLNSGRYEEAVKDFQAVLACKPEAWWARCRLAEAFICLGRPTEAFEAFDRAEEMLTCEELRADVRAWRGEARLWVGELDAALKDLNRALSGGCWLARCWRAGVYVLQGKFPEAMADLDRALVGGSRDAEAYVWRGELKRKMGRLEEALVDLNRAVELKGGIWAYLNRALTYEAMDKRMEMLQDALHIPDAVILAGFSAIKKQRPSALTAEALSEALEGALQAAGGLRRFEEYLAPVWMKGMAPTEAWSAVQRREIYGI